MARQKGTVDIANDVRGAFKRAIKMRAEGKGKALSEIMDDLLEENPIGLLNAMKGFIPKEIDATVTEKPHEQWLQSLEEDDD